MDQSDSRVCATLSISVYSRQPIKVHNYSPPLIRRDSRTHDSRRISQFSQRFTHTDAKATVVVDQHSCHKSQLSIVHRTEANSFIHRCIKRRVMIDFRQRGSLNERSFPQSILHVSSFSTFASVKNEMQISVPSTSDAVNFPRNSDLCIGDDARRYSSNWIFCSFFRQTNCIRIFDRVGINPKRLIVDAFARLTDELASRNGYLDQMCHVPCIRLRFWNDFAAFNGLICTQA